jgi:hypothetical protein
MPRFIRDLLYDESGARPAHRGQDSGQPITRNKEVFNIFFPAGNRASGGPIAQQGPASLLAFAAFTRPSRQSKPQRLHFMDVSGASGKFSLPPIQRKGSVVSEISLQLDSAFDQFLANNAMRGHGNSFQSLEIDVLPAIDTLAERAVLDSRQCSLYLGQ